MSELSFKRQERFETKLENGGGSTTVYHAELGDANVYVASEQYRKDGYEETRFGGIIVAARRGTDLELVHTQIPDGEKRRLERTLTILTFAMLQHDPHNGKWEGNERVFADPENEGVDPAYLATLGIRERQYRLGKKASSEEGPWLEQFTSEVAGKNQAAIRRTQVFKAPFPVDSPELKVWLEEERKAS